MTMFLKLDLYLTLLFRSETNCQFFDVFKLLVAYVHLSAVRMGSRLEHIQCFILFRIIFSFNSTVFARKHFISYSHIFIRIVFIDGIQIEHMESIRTNINLVSARDLNMNRTLHQYHIHSRLIMLLNILFDHFTICKSTYSYAYYQDAIYLCLDIIDIDIEYI